MSSRAWLAFLALGIIWGVPYFFIKLAVQELSPWLIAWARIVLATLILLPIAWQRGALRPLLAHKRSICAFALVEFAVPFVAISMAERWISSSIAGILIATMPLIIALISRFFGVHERLGIWRLVGLAVGLLELFERRHQNLGDEASSVGSEVSGGIGLRSDDAHAAAKAAFTNCLTFS